MHAALRTRASRQATVSPASDNTLGLRVGRFAALPRQAMKGIDQEKPWKSLR
jgi:hypothetical protein